MVVFGLVKDLASQESVVNRYMDLYSWPFCVVLYMQDFMDSPISLQIGLYFPNTYPHTTCFTRWLSTRIATGPYMKHLQFRTLS